MSSFNTQFTAQSKTQMILEPSVVSIGNWITTGCLVNMSKERYNILLVTNPLGDKC